MFYTSCSLFHPLLMPKPKKKSYEDRTGLLIPAGLFIGMGTGFLFDQLVPYLFIGLGAGFLCMFIGKLLIK